MPPQPVPQTDEPPNPWRVLLIDDEADIREVMGLALTDAGYRVTTAVDGREGVARCREAAPHIVITDIRMPHMDGLQVLEAVKRIDSDLEVIVITAYAEMSLAIRALQLDASDFVTKPVHADALHMACRRAQDRYTARRRLRQYTHLLEQAATTTAWELLRTYRFQKNLIDSSIDGIFASDARDRVVVLNPSLAELLGRDASTASDPVPAAALFAPGEWLRLRADLAAEGFGGTGRLLLYETRLITPDRETIPVQLSVAPLADDAGGGLVGFVRDLRQIRRLEQEMADQAHVLQQDKLMALGRLAASVVHEINNPLTGILNYSRLMQRVLARGPLDAARQNDFSAYLDLIEEQTAHCTRIVSGLLQFSRKSERRFAPVAVAGLLERCRLLSQHKLDLQAIQLTIDAPADLPPVRGDANQLQQCLINLIFNAVDAMPAGGELTIRAGTEESHRRVWIRVTDSGAGIDEADRARIFEPFFTTKTEGRGVGLGLATVQSIVHHHSGEIDVSGAPGQGTTFRLRFPADSTTS